MMSIMSSCAVSTHVYNKPANNLWEYCSGDWESRKRRRRDLLVDGDKPILGVLIRKS